MPIVNISLEAFGLAIVTIIFLSCLSERVRGEVKSSSFLMLLICIMIVLIADIFSWMGEGNKELSALTIIGNTVCVCASYFAMFCFMRYLKINLFGSSKSVATVTTIFGVICVATSICMIFNSIYGFAFYVDAQGHYVHTHSLWVFAIELELPAIAFVSVMLMSLCARNISTSVRIIYILFALVPMIGAIIDYNVHGMAFTEVGFVVCTVIIHTYIYQQTRKLANEQKTAIMLSQINPHFMYNSLTTMASLCDTSPKEAKNLIIDFSQYLRRNIDSLSTSELIPFEQELSHIECYLKIEKARFGDRLNILYSVQCLNFMLPALSIQPIVENAVKHGITKKPAVER